MKMRSFLNDADADRASTTIRKLARHDISGWGLTGGLAVQFHCRAHRSPSSIRRLSDLDFITSDFDSIPESLAGDFLFRHVHPLDPPGKTILQLVDAGTSLRVDVVRAVGATMSRVIEIEIGSMPMRIISLEDLIARAARLLLDLAAGIPTPSKHARDYLRMAAFVNPLQVETAWQDQRRPTQPTTFPEAATLVRDLILTRSNLLITPEYSNTATACPRCVPSPPFQLADPKLIRSLLGYY
jgi:hypothetical protein